MHSNIDCAIAFVIERGQQLSIPNVFSAYLQTIISPSSYDNDDRFETDDAIARAALITFERAMDKYPMPAPPVKTKNLTGKAPGEANKTAVASLAGRNSTKKYSAEVAQLRWEYQQAILRATADGEYQGCSCISCASLSSMRDRLPMSASEGEDGDQMREPVRVRRRRESHPCCMRFLAVDYRPCNLQARRRNSPRRGLSRRERFLLIHTPHRPVLPRCKPTDKSPVDPLHIPCIFVPLSLHYILCIATRPPSPCTSPTAFTLLSIRSMHLFSFPMSSFPPRKPSPCA